MISLIAALVVGLGPIQEPEPPPPPKNPYTPTKQSLKFDDVTVIDVTYSLEFKEKRQYYYWNSFCNNKCNGKKHIRHEDCDLTCDTKCNEDHTLETEPGFIEYPEKEKAKEFGNALVKVGSPLGAEWQQKSLMPDFSAKIAEIVKKISESDKYKWKKKFPHWNKLPCSFMEKIFDVEDWYVVANWQVFRLDKTADGTVIRVAGPKGSIRIAYVWLINADSERNDNPDVVCRCKIVMTEKEAKYIEYIDGWEKIKKEKEKKIVDGGTGSTGGGTTTGGGATPGGAGSGKSDPPKEDKPGGGNDKAPEPALPKDGKVGLPLTPEDLQTCNFEIICNSMTEAVCTGTNPYSFPIEVEIPPGTLCVSEDSSCQTCQFATRCRVSMPANSTVSFPIKISHGPYVELNGFGTATARISCLEMLKDEPNSKVKFRLEPNYDNRLVRLAEKIDSESFRGPNDQVRIWIVTDHATYQDIGKHLLPAPGGGTYLRLVYEVNRITGISFKEPEFEECLDPALLTEGGSFDGFAARWCVNTMAETKPDQLASVPANQPGKLLALFDKGNSEKNRFVEIISTMLRSNSNIVVSSALSFLTKSVPESKFAEVAASGALLGLPCALTSSDEAIVKNAIALASKAKQSQSLPALYELSAGDATEEIKQLAKNAIAEITKPNSVQEIYSEFCHAFPILNFQ